MKSLRIVLVGLLALTAAVLWLPGGMRSQATFTVDSTSDHADINPGDGICDNGAGNCTLRAAVQEANALAGDDTIVVPAGTYALNLAGTEEDAAATGDLDISDDLIIMGDGAAMTVIDGVALDRIFHVIGSVTVEIVDVKIQNGDVASGSGGAIYNYGTLTLANVTVSGNTASNSGGGIMNWGAMTVNGSSVGGNSAMSGGGIYNFGTVTLNSSTVGGNTARSSGGGIDNVYGALTLNSSTVSDNTTGGVFGGGIFNSCAELQMSNSTVSGNRATGGVAAYGGGICNIGGNATLTNVTVSSNAAAGSHGAGDGGGIANLAEEIISIDPPVGQIIIPGTLTLTNVTVNENSATEDGGGILNDSYSVVMLKNTIVANGLSGGDCFGLMTSAGHNLDSDGTCGFGAFGDLPSTNPQLGGLADNGGPTLTHALLTGSPAIDAGSGDCPPPATDQRGVVRPLDGDGDTTATCDIGAYEFEPTPTPTPAPTPTPTPTSTPTPTPEPSARVRIGSAAAAHCTEAPVPLEVKNAPQPGVAAVKVDIYYDPNVADPVSYTANPAWDMADCSLTYEHDGTPPDIARCNALEGTGMVGDALVAEISFHCVGQTGECTPLDIDIVKFADVNDNPMVVGGEDGQFCCSGPGADVNCDGVTDIVDALFVLQYDLGLRDWSDACPPPPGTLYGPAGDVNCDGEVDIVDALFILQCDLGLRDCNFVCP